MAKSQRSTSPSTPRCTRRLRSRVGNPTSSTPARAARRAKACDNSRNLTILLAAAASLLLVADLAAKPPGDPLPAELVGRVVGVHDGDTLTLLVDRREYKVRLAGIDAPELAQPYGRKAKQALSDLVFGEAIRVETAGRDRYGRTARSGRSGWMANRSTGGLSPMAGPGTTSGIRTPRSWPMPRAKHATASGAFGPMTTP